MEALIEMPWWLNLLLAVIAFVVLGSVLPSMTFQSSPFPVLSKAFAQIAWMPAVGLVLIACGSAFRSFSRGDLTKKEKTHV